MPRSNDIEERISSARKSSRQPTEGLYVVPPEPEFTTSSTEVKAEEIQMTTSSPSANSTTTDDTEFTGEENLEFVMTLPSEERKHWVLARVGAFQAAIVTYAETCLRERRAGKTVSEAEWQAIIETEGLTRAVPNEQEIYKWLLRMGD